MLCFLGAVDVELAPRAVDVAAEFRIPGSIRGEPRLVLHGFHGIDVIDHGHWFGPGQAVFRSADEDTIRGNLGPLNTDAVKRNVAPHREPVCREDYAVIALRTFRRVFIRHGFPRLAAVFGNEGKIVRSLKRDAQDVIGFRRIDGT